MSHTRLGQVLSGAGVLAVGLLALKVADAARRHSSRESGSSSRRKRRAAAAEPPSPGAAAPAPHLLLADFERFGSRLEVLYMPAASLAELADCWLAVEGRRLPAHSQVLAAQAGVLRDFVLTAREGGQTGKENHIDLTAAFAGSSLPAVTCLLHFLYSPGHADAPTLAELERGGQLAAVARLAHKLDAAAVLQGVERYLLGVVAGAAAVRQAETLRLAEDCQLDSLGRHCVSLLAGQLATAGPFWRDVLSAGPLAACRSESLADLACQLAEAVDAGGFAPPRLFDVRHAPGGGAGGFTFRIEDARWRLAHRCAPVLSPWVNIGGFEFRVWVYLNGNVDGAGNSVSVYLYCNTEHAAAVGAPEVQVAYEFEFLDRGPHRQHLLCSGTQRVTFDAQHDNWGRAKVASITELQRADRAYIVDNMVTLRVGVRVATPPPPQGQRQQQPAAQVVQAQLPQAPPPQLQPPPVQQGPPLDVQQQQQQQGVAA